MRFSMHLAWTLGLGCATADPAMDPAVEPHAEVAVVGTDAARAAVAAAPEEPPAVADEPEAAGEIDPRFSDLLLAVARDFRSWKRVDDELRFAPELCRSPMPGRFRISESGDEGTHGNKLYLLWAKDPEAYGWPATRGFIGDPPPPEGDTSVRQAIVKESFAALAHGAGGEPPDGRGSAPFSEPAPALREGHLYSAGDPLGLYVMAKLAPDTPGTDGGWVYGTLTPDGRVVTSAGRVKSCMGCHEEAPHDRLFGRPQGPQTAKNAAPR